jgi:hypothetical protein
MVINFEIISFSASPLQGRPEWVKVGKMTFGTSPTGVRDPYAWWCESLRRSRSEGGAQKGGAPTILR